MPGVLLVVLVTLSWASATGARLDLRGPQQAFYTTALHRATSHGDESAMEMLISDGADVDWMDGDGLSPLHMAAVRRHAGAVRLLLRRKANLWQRTNEGALAIHLIKDLTCGRLIGDAMAAEEPDLAVPDSDLRAYVAENTALTAVGPAPLPTLAQPVLSTLASFHETRRNHTGTLLTYIHPAAQPCDLSHTTCDRIVAELDAIGLASANLGYRGVQHSTLIVSTSGAGSELMAEYGRPALVAGVPGAVYPVIRIDRAVAAPNSASSDRSHRIFDYGRTNTTSPASAAQIVDWAMAVLPDARTQGAAQAPQYASTAAQADGDLDLQGPEKITVDSHAEAKSTEEEGSTVEVSPEGDDGQPQDEDPDLPVQGSDGPYEDYEDPDFPVQWDDSQMGGGRKFDDIETCQECVAAGGGWCPIMRWCGSYENTNCPGGERDRRQTPEEADAAIAANRREAARAAKWAANRVPETDSPFYVDESATSDAEASDSASETEMANEVDPAVPQFAPENRVSETDSDSPFFDESPAVAERSDGSGAPSEAVDSELPPAAVDQATRSELDAAGITIEEASEPIPDLTPPSRKNSESADGKAAQGEEATGATGSNVGGLEHTSPELRIYARSCQLVEPGSLSSIQPKLVAWHSAISYAKFEAVTSDTVTSDTVDMRALQALLLTHLNTSHIEADQVFAWKQPVIGKVYCLLKRSFQKLTEAGHFGGVETMQRPLFLRGWAFCLEEGLQLQWHQHSGYNGEFVVSGSFAVAVASPSATLFKLPSQPPSTEEKIAPGRVLRSRNQVGELQFFDGAVPHSTTIVDEEQAQTLQAAGLPCRLSLGFDIRMRRIAHSIPFVMKEYNDSELEVVDHWYDEDTAGGVKWNADARKFV